MSKLFHAFFDSFRVRDEGPKVVYIGKNAIGVIEFYPSDKNPFMDGHGYVRIYDNGELYCDESLAELIKYTDSAKEFMDFCFDLWKKRTNQRIFPNCIILGSDDRSIKEQVVQYRDSFPKDYFVE
jgi:hypothetical protein